MNEVFRRAVVAGMASVVLLAIGCAKPLPPPMEVGQGREALTAALDAWKAGETPKSLTERSPPISFRDDAWERGAKLDKYEVKSEETAGVSARFTVQLTMKDGKSRTVVYNVDAGRTIVIRPNF